MAQILYPRGPGASGGPVPVGNVEVHPWPDMNEVRKWNKTSRKSIVVPIRERWSCA